MSGSAPSLHFKQARIIVCIPAYNEGRFIGNVVRKAIAVADEVIVVDDGSTDNTARIAEAAGALVINHVENKDYGESIKSCFKIAKASNPDILVILDGDGQHNPNDIPMLVAPIVQGEADVVIGSRFLSKHDNIPRYRRLGIRLITFLYNLNSKVKITDAQSGFRAYNNRVINNVKITVSGMGASIELISHIRDGGFLIQEVPISCSYHQGIHSLNPVIHGLGVVLTLFMVRLRSLINWLRKRFIE